MHIACCHIWAGQQAVNTQSRIRGKARHVFTAVRSWYGSRKSVSLSVHAKQIIRDSEAVTKTCLCLERVHDAGGGVH